MPARTLGTRGLRHLLLLLCLGLVTLSGCGPAPQPEAGRPAPEAERFHGTWLVDGYPVPSATFTDTLGHDYNLQTSPSEPVTLVFFGYTHCPKHCPEMLSTLAAALQELPGSSAAKVQVLVISIDPDRDSPEVLRSYLQGFDGSFLGLRGDLDQVRAVAGDLGVEVGAREELPDGGYEIAHGAQLIGIDREHRARLVWLAGTSSEQLGEDLETFVEEQQ